MRGRVTPISRDGCRDCHIYALSLTCDSDRADDLPQRTAVTSPVGRKLLQPGTNFPKLVISNSTQRIQLGAAPTVSDREPEDIARSPGLRCGEAGCLCTQTARA